MNQSLALALLLMTAIPARAQQGGGRIFIEGIDIPEGLKGGVKEFREARAPAPIDKKPVDELFNRLSKEWSGRDGSLQGLRPVRKDGTQEVVGVALIEVDGPAQPEGVSAVDLVYRRYFSHLEARSETWKDLPKGEKQVVIWHYKIGLDGTILTVQREVRVGKMADETKGSDGIVPDPKRSKIEDRRSKDPEALAKWKELAPKLCALRPTVAA